MGEKIQEDIEREIGSTCGKAQIIQWLYDGNKSSIVVYFEPCLVKFSAIGEKSHEGSNPVSGKLQQPLGLSSFSSYSIAMSVADLHEISSNWIREWRTSPSALSAYRPFGGHDRVIEDESVG